MLRQGRSANTIRDAADPMSQAFVGSIWNSVKADSAMDLIETLVRLVITPDAGHMQDLGQLSSKGTCASNTPPPCPWI